MIGGPCPPPPQAPPAPIPGLARPPGVPAGPRNYSVLEEMMGNRFTTKTGEKDLG